MDGIGPVTSSVAQLQNQRKGIMWLFFGTGRYFFEQGSTTDDADSQRRLFAIKEPCFTLSGLDTTCTSTVSLGSLTNVTSIGSVPSETTADSSGFYGWYINLESSGNYTYNEGGTPVTRGYRAERVITDPLATTSGLAFFTTYKPYSDECGLGGKSFIWGIRYNTGGSGGASLKGTALLQVSTGSIEQINLSQSLTEMGGRRTSALEGVPPTAQGLSLLSPPPPVKRTIHIKER
jgi:type IV pilus assembly protein PilY1